MLSTKLQTVLAVAEYKNFTRAAEELNMTQPAVSHHIKQLEQEVDAPLFVRNKAGLKLTPQGESVVNYARRMKALHERMFAELQNAERHLSLLRIGITHTSECCIYAYPSGISDFLEAHVAVIAHHEHLALCFGKSLDYAAHIGTYLVVDHKVLDVFVAEVAAVEQIYFLIVGGDAVFRFFLPKMINDKVVGYAGEPCAELAGLSIATLLQGHDDLDKCFLKNIVGYVPVLYDSQNVRK